MNSGQSFLSLGAMTLVALIILQVNTGFVMTSSTLLDNKLDILAISLASSIIEEASGKVTDQKGRELNIHRKNYVVASNGKIHKKILKVIR